MTGGGVGLGGGAGGGWGVTGRGGMPGGRPAVRQGRTQAEDGGARKGHGGNARRQGRLHGWRLGHRGRWGLHGAMGWSGWFRSA